MSEDLLIGEVVVESQTYSLVQVCVICGVATDRIAGLVAFGIIAPTGISPSTWRFNEFALHRAKKAFRLHRGLGLDLQGLALTLELLDEIDRLRAQVDRTHASNPIA